MNTRFRFAVSATLALSFAGVCGAQTAPSNTVTLTFEGLKDQEQILNFYNNGFGGKGSGPGPNYGIAFGTGALAIISADTTGTGNFDRNPSGDTVAYFLTGGGLIMNVAAGFTNGFSFYYAAANTPGVITVYDGPDASGNVLATLPLPVTGTDCSGSTQPYSCWTPIGVTFSGTAKSVNFGGVANFIGFDNITLGSVTPNKGIIIANPSLPNGSVGVPYASQTFTASGGTSPYTWSAAGLPDGLVLNSSTGILSGTPTTAGTFNVTVTATDSSSIPQKGSNTYQLIIAPAPILTPTLRTISPSTATIGSAPITIQITGTNFTSNSVVQWTDSTGKVTTLSSTFQSATQLQATIPTALLNAVGTAQVTVANGTSNVSNALTFSIAPLAQVTLTSVSPNSATQGAGDLTIQATGTNFLSTSVLRWTDANGKATNLVTAFQSATLLNANVPAALLANIGAANIAVVTPNAADSNSVTFTINPAQVTLTSISPASAPQGSPDVTVQLTGTNFLSGATVSWAGPTGSAKLAATFQSSTQLQATIPASLLTSPGTAQITVSNSSTNVSSAQTFTIVGALPPDLLITIPTPGVVPTDQPGLKITLNSPATTTYTGTIQLSFTPDSSVSGWPANQTNAQVMFAGGGTTVTFTIPQGSTSATIPNNGTFQQGTVAGTITARLTQINGVTVPASSAPSVSEVVQPIPPVITASSVKITGVTSSGFNVEFDAYSTTRDLTTASFTFQAASGATLDGSTQTVSLASAATTWFASSGGLQAGGSFHAIVPFTYSGDTSALATVTVTVSNSKGTSAPVSGGK